MQKMARSHEHRCISLLDLPESLLIHICRYLPTESKCRAELVCKTLREVLSNPAPGTFVWDVIRLDDTVFSKAPLSLLNRWLLKRIQGVLKIHHSAAWGEDGPHLEATSDAAVRDRHTLFITLPLLSGVLSPGAEVHMDLTWVTAETLFTMEQPELVSQYWSCMAASLTHLELHTQKDVTEDMSAILCQLASLQHLALCADINSEFRNPEASITLDLPWLEELAISAFNSTRLTLNCPRLQELALDYVQLMGFSGMPSSIRELDLEVAEGSMSLDDIFPAHGAKLLEKLTLGDEEFSRIDPAIVQKLCLNGKLRHLSINAAASKAFSVGASWRAVPHTLEDVTLELPFDKGIPRILEQLPRLTALSLRHSGPQPAHLDRPLIPFLEMPRLEKLELVCCGQSRAAISRGAQCTWTPVALKLIGMAQKRIMQMRLTPPGRSITFVY